MKEPCSLDSNEEFKEILTNNNINPTLTKIEPDQTKENENEEKNIEDINIEENGKKNLKASKLSDDECADLGETLLNKKDFMNSLNKQKKSFCETRYIKRVLVIFLYSAAYIVNAIYIRINSLNLIPIKASFLQGALFSIGIPISFFISSNRNFKRNKKYMGKEKEVSNIEIERNMKDDLSDFMNKKYYEVYYHYISKFYLLTAFFSVLYFLSIYFFYQGISYTQPLFGQLFLAFIPIIILLIRIADKNINCKKRKVFSIICMIIASFLFAVSYLKNCYIKSDDNDYLFSILFLGIFTIIQSTFIYYAKKVFKKYFYYVDVLEFMGYAGIYIIGLVPLILIILYAIFYSELINNNPSGIELFYVIGKAFFSTFVCDLSLIYILKYFTLKVTCKIMIINFSAIYLIFSLVTGKEILKDYYFLGGQAINLLIIFLLLQDIYKKNLKREVYEVKKQRLRASL